jgi:hypothetical protein
MTKKHAMDAILPQGFEDLADLVDEWALATTAERFAKRSASTLDEMKRFYDRVFPRLEVIFTALGTKPLDALAEDERRLLALALSLAEVSLAVERYGAPLPFRGLPASRFEIAANQLDDL